MEDKTPFELWHGKRADIGDFRIFGSEVYVHIPKERRKRLDAKAKKCIFIRYGNDVKGYRMLDPETNKVEVACDVRFLSSELSTEISESKDDSTECNDRNCKPYEW